MVPRGTASAIARVWWLLPEGAGAGTGAGAGDAGGAGETALITCNARLCQRHAMPGGSHENLQAAPRRRARRKFTFSLLKQGPQHAGTHCAGNFVHMPSFDARTVPGISRGSCLGGSI